MKKAVWLTWLLCGMALCARPWILLFGSLDCDECNGLKAYWTQKYTADTDPVLVFTNVDKTSNYRFLSRVEDTLGIVAKGSDFPILLIGDQMVNGREGFNRLEPQLPELMGKCSQHVMFDDIRALVAQATTEHQSLCAYDYKPKKQKKTSPEEQATTDARTGAKEPAAEEPAVQVVAQQSLLFFEQPGCQKCSRQKKEFELLRELCPQLDIASWDVTTLEGQAMLSRARKAYGIAADTKNLAPMVCWRDGYITGRLAEAKELAEALVAPSSAPVFWLTPLTDAEIDSEHDRMGKFLHALTWSGVVLGGLVDGINPCAFATSVFLISYLLYLKRRRRDIVIVGGSFCLGVFVTYFLFGLALSSVLRQVQQWQWAKLILYGGLGVVGLVLCVLHLRDALRYRRTGKAHDMDMGLSKDTHRSIHEKIRKFTGYRTWLMGPAAVVLGALVSAMELACTGQVYFPMLAAMSERGLDARFLCQLTCYNVFFILPLAVITWLAAYGVGAKALADWAKNHVFSTKITMAVLFAVLGGLMILMAIKG